MDETEKQSEEEEEAQEIWSWGAGTDGQLATTSLNDQYTPQLLLLLPNSLSCYGQISHLSCGGAHVIALTSVEFLAPPLFVGGKVLTWGRGSSGQLGHGGIVPNCLKAMVVSSLLDSCISHVSAGWNHSAFVSDLGCLFTCGDGSFGQLGHGDYQSICSPVEVSSFSSKHVEQVACGMRHTLVLIKGNLEDQIHGFGSNKRGQLSISKDKVKTTSISQPCLGFESIQVASIIANGDHSAAISTDGNLYTWGRSFNGLSDVCVPEIVHSSSKIKEVAMGWNHALLLSGEGEVSMLGGRLHGVLSEPEKIAHDHNLSDSGNTRLRKVPGLDGKKVVQISTGSEHSAIVTENGEIYTWGWGEHGQLGHGNTTDSILPQCVNIPSVDNRGWLTSKVYCGSGFTFAIRTRCHQCSRP